MSYPFEFTGGSTLYEGSSVKYFHQPGWISMEAQEGGPSTGPGMRTGIERTGD